MKILKNTVKYGMLLQHYKKNNVEVANYATYDIVLIEGKLEVACFKKGLIGSGSEFFTYVVFTNI